MVLSLNLRLSRVFYSQRSLQLSPVPTTDPVTWCIWEVMCAFDVPLYWCFRDIVGPAAFISMDVKSCKLNLFYVRAEVRIAVRATCLFRILTGPSTKLSSVLPSTYWDSTSIRHECFLLYSFHLSVFVPFDLGNCRRGKVSWTTKNGAADMVHRWSKFVSVRAAMACGGGVEV